MRIIKTLPINNDRRFLAVRDVLNPLLAHYGFPLVLYKGSDSWLAGATDPGHSTETYFKLLYRGPHKPYVFGARKDFVAKIEKLRAVRWPIEFCVLPSTTVPFCGFEIEAGEGYVAAERLEKMLRALPEPDPRIAIPLNGTNDADFDAQLSAL